MSFFVELPFDLGLADNAVSTLLDGREILEGWEGIEAVPLPGAMSPSQLLPHLEPGLRPCTSFWFHRVSTRGRSPFEATEKAFGGVLRDPSEGLIHRLRRKVRWRFAPRGVKGEETRSVVRITRVFASDGALDRDALSDHFDAGLSKLNELVVAIGVVSRDPAIAPVALADLPLAIPYLVSDLGGTGREHSLLILHYGVQVEADLLSAEEVQHAFNVAAKQHGPGHPFFSLGEAQVEARRARGRGRAGQAVLETGTAFELLISTLVREVGMARGYEDAKVTGILNAGLRNIVTDHVPILISTTVDLDDIGNPFGQWWAEGYSLRNRVVHEGYRPSVAEAATADRALHGVIVHVAEKLHADEVTRSIAALLAGDNPPDAT